jgi:hypothetical protein
MYRIIAGMWPITAAGFAVSLYVCGQYWARGAMWCLCCLAIGAAIGFLFGIPKVLQRDGKAMMDFEAGAKAYRQRVNTNLEDISDWLTKIIVGLGLVQLANIPRWTKSVALIFAESVHQPPEEYGFLGAIVLFFLVGGFLFGYLITRLFLQGALGRADRAAAYPDEGALPKQTAQEVPTTPTAGSSPAVSETMQHPLGSPSALGHSEVPIETENR